MATWLFPLPRLARENPFHVHGLDLEDRVHRLIHRQRRQAHWIAPAAGMWLLGGFPGHNPILPHRPRQSDRRTEKRNRASLSLPGYNDARFIPLIRRTGFEPARGVLGFGGRAPVDSRSTAFAVSPPSAKQGRRGPSFGGSTCRMWIPATRPRSPRSPIPAGLQAALTERGLTRFSSDHARPKVAPVFPLLSFTIFRIPFFFKRNRTFATLLGGICFPG